MARRYNAVLNNNTDQYDVYKIITLGNAGIGKSTLITSYTHGICQDGPLPSDFPKTLKTLRRKDRTIHLDIWDTAGQERFDSITSQYYRDAHGCLLCFDISDEQSYKDLDSWRDRFDYYCSYDTTQTILVGLKSDLRQKGNSSSSRALKPKSAGELLAINLGIKYMEVNKFDQESIDTMFEELLKLIEKVRQPVKRDSIKLQEEVSEGKKPFSIRALCSRC